MEPRRRNLVLPAALLLFAILAVLLGLARLSRPDSALKEQLLNCTQENQNGWRFETAAARSKRFSATAAISTARLPRVPDLSLRSG